MRKRRQEDISLGTIGGKIRRLRELRGWSQKELGIRCGFPEMSADVRIRQYESNSKVPREKAIKALADALDVDETALFDADLSESTRYIHALFDIEDFKGLSPVEIDGKYYLEFSGKNIFGKEVLPHEYIEFLKSWADMKAKCTPMPEDDSETVISKRTEYDLWRYRFQKAEAERTHSLRKKHK